MARALSAVQRRAPRCATVALLALGLPALLHAAETPPPPAPIILITLDTTRADHLSCYGYFRPTSPMLDAFARDAVLFEHAVTPAATTLPSHLSLMTSTYPPRHGIKGNFEHFHQRFAGGNGLVTFAQMLRRIGYSTTAFVSSAAVKAATGINAGFEAFDEPDGIERNAADTTDRVLHWLNRRTKDPFFLWVHYVDPHSPYHPPAPFDDAYKIDKDLRRFVRRISAYGVGSANVLRVHNGYDGEIRYLDEQLGHLFARMKHLGLYDRAAIVVVSDHGEGLGQHRWLYHGEIHNEQLFVPLLIKLPATHHLANLRRNNLASTIDVLPTLTAALRLPLAATDRAQFDGVDALAPEPLRRTAFAQRTPNALHGWARDPKYTLVGTQWKYVWYKSGIEELYDLEADPFEMRNLVRTAAPIAASMRQELLALVPKPQEAAAHPTPEALPPGVVEQLHQLGYSD